MSTLEDLVRRSLAAHEGEAPPAGALAARVKAGRRRRARQRLLVFGAACGVVGVVATVTVLSTGSTNAPQPVPTTAAIAPPPIPAGTRAIGYRGVEMFVPLDFQRGYDCAGPKHSVYLVGDGAVATCAVRLPEELTYVTIRSADKPPGSDGAQATEPTTIDGAPAHRGIVPATTGGPATSVLYLDEQHLLISVQAPDAATREQLLGTVHLIEIDRSGCAIKVPDLEAPTTTRTGSELISGAPTSLGVCYYTDHWIRSSATLAGERLQSLVAQLNALPAGVARDPQNYGPDRPYCQADARSGFILRMTYASGDPLELVAHISGCSDIYVGDKHGTSRLDFATTVKLVDLTGYDGGFPSPGNLIPG